MRITQVGHPAQLQDCWPFVCAGLEKILALCPDTWKPEDIYTALRSQRAFLHLVGDQGFFVTEIQQEPHRLEKALNVWALYMQPNQPEAVREQIVNELDRMAVAAGCPCVRFLSPRRGWARYLEGYFVEKMTVYERKQP